MLAQVGERRTGDQVNSGPAALVGIGAAVVLALVVGGPVTGGPVGVSTADAARCAASSVALSFPTRPDRDRALLPVGYRSLAPVTALWCRYDADGALRSAHDLDAARTARLAAVLATPSGGWPLDALEAKRIPPLTPAQVVAASAPPCSASVAAEWVVFTYGQGPDAAVLLRGDPCRDVANGVIRLRAGTAVVDAFAELGSVSP